MNRMKYNFSLIDINGPNGNANFLIKQVTEWLKNEGASQTTINEFVEDAKSSDYSHLLNVCNQYTGLANELAYDNGFVDECDCMIDD